MAIVIQADPSLPNLNCYSTLAEAEAFHETRLHNEAWVEATDNTKKAALIWSSRELDILEWKGWKTDPLQPKEWPRTGVWQDGGDYGNADIYNAYQFDPDEIPQFLKDGTAEMAMYLIANDTTAPSGTEGFKSIKVDTIELVTDSRTTLDFLPTSTKNLFWRYLVNSSGICIPVVRVG